MLVRSQRLHEDVCRIVEGRHVMEFYVAIRDLISCVMIVCVDVLGMVVTEIVLSEGNE